VIGRGSKKVSNKMRMEGYSNDPYNDLIKAFLPRSKYASARSKILAKKAIRPIGMVKNRLRMSSNPETPPVTKFTGTKKK
jgi:hypothetical protein